MKKIVIAVVVILLLVCVIGWGIGSYLFKLALDPHSDKSEVFKAPQNEMNVKEDEEAIAAQKANDEWFDSHLSYATNIETYDQLKLNGYVIENENDSHLWVIGAHGYTGEAKQMTSRAKHFYGLGYNVLLPDARGHGNSQGDYIGMGWDDRLDIVSWCHKIIEMDQEAKIVLYGVSMGGATVMMASGEDLPDNVVCVVEDCGYTSVYDEFAHQLKGIFNLPEFPIMNFAQIVTSVKAGYNFKEASALKQVAKTKVPILFIHGDSDTFVPSFMAQEVYDVCPTEKELLIVQGAGHGEAASKDPTLYWDTVTSFVNKYTK